MESLFIAFVYLIFIVITLVSLGILYGILKACNPAKDDSIWFAVSLISLVILGMYGIFLLDYLEV